MVQKKKQQNNNKKKTKQRNHVIFRKMFGKMCWWHKQTQEQTFARPRSAVSRRKKNMQKLLKQFCFGKAAVFTVDQNVVTKWLILQSVQARVRAKVTIFLHEKDNEKLLSVQEWKH